MRVLPGAGEALPTPIRRLDHTRCPLCRPLTPAVRSWRAGTPAGEGVGNRCESLGGAVPAYVSGYAGSSTGLAGSPPLFSQRSSSAMASEKEWATVA